ncbi:MAG: putative lipid II flippase FtsW [Bdellovibrio sp. CG10_big_fil_rev_8_21_14_0_10_47_8]|nr:MAG: putative lipid II flippase FtsW [Bdellovibrio sp. CG10_big_fil_rev_8_21_14_0_10_47_8]
MLKPLSSPLLLTLLALLGGGLVQVYSSSYIFATESFGDGLYFFERQLLFSGIAFVALLVAAHVPIRWIEKWGWMMWMIAGIGVILTFVPGLGVRAGGAARWIQLPLGLRIEPSEALKFSFSLLFASFLTKDQNFLGRLWWWAVILLIAVPLGLLLRQPDFGSFAIIICVAVALLLAFGLRWSYLIASFAVILPAFYLLVMRVPYRRARVLAFLDPWADPEQKGFQVIQSMLSFHSGGITGSGLGQGQGKLFFLPEAHTDFTLAVFGEEMGFIGFCLLLGLYGFVVLRGFQIALKTENLFRKALALGISMTFALGVFINAGVVMGLLPTKGLTLPFFSYGGSSLITLCFMFGLLLNIEKNLCEETQSPFFPRRSRLD